MTQAAKRPAAARLIEAANREVEEAMLTGESLSSRKTFAPLSVTVLPIADRTNLIYDDIIAQTARRYDWAAVPEATLSTRERDQRLREIAAVAGEIVRAHPGDFIVGHPQSWLWSFIPQEHKFWYTHLTGRPGKRQYCKASIRTRAGGSRAR